jgi:hypothetical protein
MKPVKSKDMWPKRMLEGLPLNYQLLEGIPENEHSAAYDRYISIKAHHTTKLVPYAFHKPVSRMLVPVLIPDDHGL